MRSGSGWRTKWNLMVVAALSNSLAFKWEQTCNFVKLNFLLIYQNKTIQMVAQCNFLTFTACQLNTSLLFLWECLLFTNWGGIFVGLVIIYKEAQEKRYFYNFFALWQKTRGFALLQKTRGLDPYHFSTSLILLKFFGTLYDLVII